MTEDTGNKFSGELIVVGLSDIVQLACLAQLTHTIAVQCLSVPGAIHIHSGQVCHAETGSMEGEAAFYEMFMWREGQFEMTPCENGCEVRTINKNWEFLLIEAMRQFDLKFSGELEGCSTSSAKKRAGFQGMIADVALLDIVQLMCLGGGSRYLEVESDRGAGRILSGDGQVLHAEIGDLQGEEAFNEIFKFESGRFKSAPVDRGDVPSTIDKPWEHLLMEAMRFRDELAGGSGASQEEREERIESLLQRIQKLKVTEKIRLAMVGDKETRGILIRDPNRLVQFAIVTNPRITEGEIAAIVCSRSVEEDVLRRIANNREWLKYYPIRLGLSTNPKTPIPISSKLLATLTQKDLKLIAKSKSVSTAVAQAARRMLPEKE